MTAAAPATAEALQALHDAFERFWRAVDAEVPGGPTSTWRLELTTAVGEIGANIIQHAHPPGTPPSMVDLRLRMLPRCVVVRFADRGVAYVGPLDVENGAPMSEENAGPTLIDELELMESGYGLRIARAALDVVQYRRTTNGTNIWRLVKRWEPDAA